ncbi:MFS transporter [Sediminivirga luteola]|uniref:Putative transporter n=1 Tax=Sediminivirga luteola TaxID=1774748 RepID=A0A8J2U0A3_9MICO|nr:MFS transporter [Sediminivirga luteola]MCI2266785.1 MFS transporter [Sediminivirga luteola]GGA23668.1 putative transporter [Sediminivirga luteola]
MSQTHGPGGFEGYRAGEPGATRISVALLLAGLATFTMLYSTQALLPALARTHGITPGQSALSVSLATAGLGIGLLVAAPLAERLGRTPLIHGSLFLSSGLGLVAAVVPSWDAFLVLRLLQGFVMAGLPAVAAVYLREEMHRGSVSRATAIYIFGTSTGGLSGRIVSAGLLELSEWTGFPDASWADLGWITLAGEHFALLGTAVLSLGCAIVCRLLLPASRRFVPRPVPVRRLPADFGRVFTDPVLLGLCAISALMMGVFVGTFNALGFRLEAAPYLLPIGLIGLIYLAYPIAGMVGVRAGRIADARGPSAVMTAGVLVMLIGVAVVAVPWLPGILLGVVVLCCGFFTVHAIASAWVPNRASATGRSPAHAASMYALFYYAGSSVSGNLTPQVWQDGGWGAVLMVTGGLVVAAFVIAVLLRRGERRR